MNRPTNALRLDFSTITDHRGGKQDLVEHRHVSLLEGRNSSMFNYWIIRR